MPYVIVYLVFVPGVAGGRSCVDYDGIVVETHGKTGLIALNQPRSLNALSSGLMQAVGDTITAFNKDSAIGAIVITGSKKAFAAGADIKEMADKTFPDTYQENFLANWEAHIGQSPKPVIAAVGGYALGGGCELAMMCDMIIAAPNAAFGQPEILLGTMPGAGGTQRLTRAIGKSRAMHMILTGDRMGAQEAKELGLVATVVEKDEDLVPEALKVGNKIASFSQPITAMCKEAVNAAYELPLAEGTRFERRLFHSTFATKDQKEGMGAFVDKRKPNFTNQ